MNRTGQPPQRQTALGPNQGMGAPFRGPFPPTYGIPSRNPLQPPFSALANNHQARQGVITPGFMRNQTSYPFGSGAQQQQQQQQSQQQQQQHSTHPTQQPQHQQQHALQQQSSSASTLPPHLAQNAAPSMGTAPSVSSTSEVGLDPNDFPALGSGSAPNPITNSPATNLASSYASQAQTGLQGPTGGLAGQGGSTSVSGNTQQPRDFTPDDFPALGGQAQTQQSSTNPETTHPPGLNGFSQGDHHSQQRQGMLSSTQSQPQNSSQAQPQQPGILNVGPQRTGVPPGFQTEAEKRMNNFTSNNQNGVLAHGPPQSGHLQQHMSTPAPSSIPPNFQSQQGPTPNHQPASAQQYATNSVLTGDGQQHAGQAPGITSTIPQTPAQQVLISPADRWGLLGLLAMIKSTDVDQNLLSFGTDLGTMGLDMQQPGNLYSTFITPWSDSSAAHAVEPDFHIPACYNVHPPPPGPSKVQAFSDETVFFMFYAAPRDSLQEIAAQELFNRNWRYHKELRLWLTKEAGTSASRKVEGGEHGTYTYWDPESWEKQRKELTVLYADLEEKSMTPAFQGPTIQPNNSLPQQAQQPLQQQQASHMHQSVPASRGAFQGMGIVAGM